MVGIGIVIPILTPLILNNDTGLIPMIWTSESRNIILGLLIAAYPLFQFFGAPILGALSDKYGRKKLLAVSVLGTALSHILFAIGVLTNTLWLLFASRAFDGFTGGNIAVANSSIADMSKTSTDKSKNFALVGVAFGLGFVLGPVFGGLLSQPELVSWFNASTPFFFAAILSAISLYLVLFKYEETLENPITRKISLFLGFQNIGKAFRMKNLGVMFITIFFYTLGFNFFTQFFPFFLIDRYDFGELEIAYTFAYIGLCLIVVQGFITRGVANKLKAHKVLRFSFLGAGLAVLTLLIPKNPISLIFTQALIALFAGLTFPNITALLSETARDDEQGEILGLSQSVQAISTAIPPLLAGFLVNINPNLPTILAGGFIILAWLIFWFGFKAHAKLAPSN